MNRKRFLQMAAATAIGAPAILATAAEPGATRGLRGITAAVGDEGLGDRAARKGILFGAAARRSVLEASSLTCASFLRECAILVPECELQWNWVRRDPNSFAFHDAEWLLAWSRTHGMPMRGHALLWHEALPEGFGSDLTRAAAESQLVEHVRTVATRFAGRLHSWDVVNEAVWGLDGRADGLRRTPWLERIGPEYLDLAFHTAADADPHTLRVLNDFRVEYDTPQEDTNRAAMLRLLERLLTRGVPVQALGIQAHLAAGEKRFNGRKFRGFLGAVSAMGLKILVTELDVADQALPMSRAQRDLAVADEYARFLAVALDEPAVKAVLTWGLSDHLTWLRKFRPRADGLPPRPLPLDEEHRRKPAWSAIAAAFDAAPARAV